MRVDQRAKLSSGEVCRLRGTHVSGVLGRSRGGDLQKTERLTQRLDSNYVATTALTKQVNKVVRSELMYEYIERLNEGCERVEGGIEARGTEERIGIMEVEGSAV